MKLFLFLLIQFYLFISTNSQNNFKEFYDLGIKYFQQDDLTNSKYYLHKALEVTPLHAEVNGILGSIYLLQSDFINGIKYLELSFQIDNYSNSDNIANYLHGLLMNGNIIKGRDIFDKVILIYPTHFRILVNGILLYYHSEKNNEVIPLILKHFNTPQECTKLLMYLIEIEYFQVVETLGLKLIEIFNSNYDILFHYALSLHYQNKLVEALKIYESLLQIKSNSLVLINIGAIYQVIGNYDQSKLYYQQCYDSMKTDAGYLNNYGILLLQSDKENEIIQGVNMLKESLIINPSLDNTLVNLASYYQDECMINEAEILYSRALNISLSRKFIEIRLATIMSPIVTSWNQMLYERNKMIKKLIELSYQGHPLIDYYRELDPVMDRIHFYIVYAGLNDRIIQELITKIYENFILNISKISSHLLDINKTNNFYQQVNTQTKIKIGFFSKFFGVYEPHGLLLDGVMKYLPRKYFEVFAISPIMTEGKYFSPTIKNNSDHVIFVPLLHSLAYQQICDLKLDILIFADTLSEPTSHFLAHSRLASIQIAFWGNPITSGSKMIDYFISNDFMEHPYRTRFNNSNFNNNDNNNNNNNNNNEDPYTEQLVLLPGQGIWYSSPNSYDNLEIVKYLGLSITPQNDVFDRGDFNLDINWFIFLCPQSLFKLHPLFDQVLTKILHESPTSHIVLTTGRKKSWTSIFVERISKSLHPYLHRCHFISRVSSQKFLALIKLANVLLHPFPFDGSRTSADSLSVGIPYVTLPSEYLRGRMGSSFLRTMNIPELVAHNMSEYIQISVRLASDPLFYTYIKSLIEARSWLIWEDMECPYSWTRFLLQVSGLPSMNWEEFIVTTNRNIKLETKYRNVRQKNQESFDLRWGKETWLLDDQGHVFLPYSMNENETLPIFNDWKYPHNQEKNTNLIPSNYKNEDNQINSHQSNIISNILQQAHQYAREGSIDLAFETEKQLLNISLNDPKVYLELGIFQFLLGNYVSAIDYCEKSLHILQQRDSQSSQVFGCIGISATYLINNEEKCLTNLYKAWNSRSINSSLESSLFQFNEKSIMTSLATGLFTFHKYSQCIDFLTNAMKLPIFQNGGGYILLLSIYELSNEFIQSIQLLEKNLIASGTLKDDIDLIYEIKRIQKDYDSLITISRDCVVGLYQSNNLRNNIIKIFQDVNNIVLQISHNKSKIENKLITNNKKDGGKEKIILLSQYYYPTSSSISNNISNTYDIDVTLLKNLANPLISDIYLLNERKFQLDHFPYQYKLHQIIIDKRVTFQDMFNFANLNLDGQIIIIANSDIYFDETLNLLKYSNLQFNSTVITLSKWTDWTPPNNIITLYPRIDSQDAWIFKSPINQDVIDLSVFYLGVPRCDNRLASILINSGYKVVNPALKIHAIEFLSTYRETKLYDMKGAPIGETNNVFINSQYPN